MGAFFGIDEYTLDPKNRLFFPPRYRQALDNEQGKHFMLTTGLNGCLYLFLPSQWNALLEGNMLEFKSGDKEEERAFKRFFFGNAAEAPLDSMGRILIGQNHKNYAELSKKVVVIGVGNKAELWDVERWERYKQQAIVPNEQKFSKIYDI